MQPGWATFSLGLIVGAGVFVLVGVMGNIAMTDSAFCDRNETLLTCSRNWINVFAVLAGSAVVVVTVMGQKAEADRHALTIRQARLPHTLRVDRSKRLIREWAEIRLALDAAIEEASNLSTTEVGSRDFAPWTKMRALGGAVGRSLEYQDLADVRELLDWEANDAVMDLEISCKALGRAADAAEYDVPRTANDIFPQIVTEARSFAEQRALATDAAFELSEALGNAIEAITKLRADFDLK